MFPPGLNADQRQEFLLEMVLENQALLITILDRMIRPDETVSDLLEAVRGNKELLIEGYADGSGPEQAPPRLVGGAHSSAAQSAQ
jgi:hypothetical protein